MHSAWGRAVFSSLFSICRCIEFRPPWGNLIEGTDTPCHRYGQATALNSTASAILLPHSRLLPDLDATPSASAWAPAYQARLAPSHETCSSSFPLFFFLAFIYSRHDDHPLAPFPLALPFAWYPHGGFRRTLRMALRNRLVLPTWMDCP